MKFSKSTLTLAAAAALLSGQAVLAQGSGGTADPSAAPSDAQSSGSSMPSDTTGATSGSTTTTTTTETTQEKSAQTKATVPKSQTLLIQFAPGVSALTPDQQSKLSSLVSAARTSGKIDKIHVAVWSDQPFPKQGQPDLPEASKQLAQARADQVDKFLSQQNVGDVETYNMAEKSNWLARTFNTNEAELKSMFAQRGATPITNEDFQTIKKEGGVSKAIVVVAMAGQPKAGAAPGAAAPGTAPGAAAPGAPSGSTTAPSGGAAQPGSSSGGSSGGSGY